RGDCQRGERRSAGHSARQTDFGRRIPSHSDGGQMNLGLTNSPGWFPRMAPVCAAAVLIQVMPRLRAQEVPAPPTNVDTNSVSAIDLPTTLRLANAQNLDIQIARQRLKEAKANRESAVEQFFPWISPGAAYRRHEGRIQAVDGTVFDADKQAYTVGGVFTAQVELGEAIYKSLAAKQLVAVADHALESQRQDTILAAVQGYYDLCKAKAL